MANLNGSDRQVPSDGLVPSADAARGHTEPKFVHAVDLIDQRAGSSTPPLIWTFLPYSAETSSTEGLAGRPDAMTGAPG
jgi:hypothetical protein